MVRPSIKVTQSSSSVNRTSETRSSAFVAKIPMPSVHESVFRIAEVYCAIHLFFQVQELNPWITMEIVVKRHQTATARRRKGGKVSVCPLSTAQVELSGPWR